MQGRHWDSIRNCFWSALTVKLDCVWFKLSAFRCPLPTLGLKSCFLYWKTKKKSCIVFDCFAFVCNSVALCCIAKIFFFILILIRYFLRLSVYIWFGESRWYISHPALNFDWTVCNLSYQSGSHPHSAATFEKDLFKVHLSQSGGKIAHLIIQILNGVLRKRVVAVKCWRWRQELKSAC